MNGTRENRFQSHYGEDTTNVDEKGRIVLAKRKREWLGANFTFIYGDLGVIEIMPQPIWERTKDFIEGADSRNPDRKFLLANYLGTAEPDQNCDKDGRVVVPVSLREMTALKGEVKLVGIGESILVLTADQRRSYVLDGDALNPHRLEKVSGAMDRLRAQEVMA